MIIWIVSCVSLITALNAEEGSQYECGPHGRFEYCIDDIPGCVIGCHCHPGFYFDTDTKICEASSKLTQHFRRNFITDPTPPQYYTDFTSNEIVHTPTPTTIDPINGKVDDITKDADDLGDWLYNQFFKTIEKQVINNTDTDTQKEIKTRRSNTGPTKKKPKRKPSRKYWQRSSKKKGKKQGLRRKLLRITEDDSLFDSSSSSDDDSSYETDSSYSSSSSSESDRRGKPDKDHGHKKFIFFNKSPKPALPSFIFLPGMDTPFYPPIGLPPPPAMPMYPIVPVPPMGPMFPHPLCHAPPCDDVKSTPNSSLTTLSSSSDSGSISTTTSTTTTTTITAPTSIENAANGNLRKRINNRKHGKSRKETKQLTDSAARKRTGMGKTKRTKMKNPSYDEDILEQSQDADEPVLDYSFQDERPPAANKFRARSRKLKHNRFEDVDFKYLSELIHRAELNNTNFKPDFTNDIREKIIGPLNGSSRRMFQDTNGISENEQRDHRRNLQKPVDESYYSNLGREIASLIRKIDSKGERQVNIEVEHNKYTPIHPILLENRYLPHSLWERYARSPISYVSTYYNNQANYYKVSDENLFNLENKVEIFATTTPPLSLNELENIISTMKKAKTQITSTKISNIEDMKPSNKSLNINLLSQPKVDRFEKLNENIENSRNEQFENPKFETYLNPHFEKKYLRFNFTKSKPENVLNISPTVYTRPNKPINQWPNLQFTDFQKLTNWLFKQNITKQNQRLPNTVGKSTRKFNNKKDVLLPNNSNNGYNLFVRLTTSKPQLDYNKFNPTMLGNINYLKNNNNKYPVKQAAIPFHLYPAPNKISTTYNNNYVKPSYFHHEINQYDVFDQF